MSTECQKSSRSVFAGRIAIIDIPNRNVALQMPAGEIFEFNVAPTCRVILNGEPVRLRLLLIGDEVEISYIDREGQLTASSIVVQTRQRNRP